MIEKECQGHTVNDQTQSVKTTNGKMNSRGEYRNWKLLRPQHTEAIRIAAENDSLKKLDDCDILNSFASIS
jgi:hypothetical protein